jgi:hypothetical protein
MKYALIIGNNRYDDAKLAQLKTPAADSQALANVLGSETIGSFDEVTPLVNQTESDVRRAISTFLTKKKPDDLVLLYFSGHGVLDDRGRLYLALRDTQVDLLKATSIPSSFIADEMDSCRSKRQILILDCCHSGAFARGTKGEQKAITETTFEGSGFGRVVLTASDSTQYALEGDQIIKQSELSLFTHFLLEGLKTGEADTNHDGHISLDEWYDYTYAKVISETPRQVPHKWSYNQRGDLIIARNPYLKKKIAELPPELLHALESSFVGIRESAVNELGNYLHSSDPEMVVLAVKALQKMKEDDSRKISSLAEKLLMSLEQSRRSNVREQAQSFITPASIEPASASVTVQPTLEERTVPVDNPSAWEGFSSERSFWAKWIGTAILAVVLSALFYYYNLSVSGAGTFLPVLLFSVVSGVSSLIQWFLFRERLVGWVAGNLTVGFLLGLLHNYLYDVNTDWWDLHLSILLAVWLIGNFALGPILRNRSPEKTQVVPSDDVKHTSTNTNIFFISLSLSLLLFALLVFSSALSLTSAADVFMILLGAANILISVAFLLKKDIPRNLGFISLAVSSLLYGIFIGLEYFTTDFRLSLYSIPGFISLVSGIFFATQSETRKNFRFLLLSGFLVLLGIAHIARDISIVYDSFSILAAMLAIVAAMLFFQEK